MLHESVSKDRTQKLLNKLTAKHLTTGSTSGMNDSGSAESSEVLKKRVSELEIENCQLKSLIMRSKNPSYFVVLTFVYTHTQMQSSTRFTYFGMTTSKGIGSQLLMLSFQP